MREIGLRYNKVHFSNIRLGCGMGPHGVEFGGLEPEKGSDDILDYGTRDRDAIFMAKVRLSSDTLGLLQRRSGVFLPPHINYGAKVRLLALYLLFILPTPRGPLGSF